MNDKVTRRVAVLGPKGQCGAPVVNEFLERGYEVVGISRNPPATWDKSGKYSSCKVDINDLPALTEAFSQNFDAIIISYAPSLSDFSQVLWLASEAHAKIKAAVLRSKHKGYTIIIGGAGSLHMPQGGQLLEIPDFPFSWWMTWPLKQFDYMMYRLADHGNPGFSRFIRGISWARKTIENPGWFSWMLRPVARLYLRYAKTVINSPGIQALIFATRNALFLWEGTTGKKWSFISPPAYLRDKGIKTGEYKVMPDTEEEPALEALKNGIYGEDMAAAIADEVETQQFVHAHWSAVGPIDVSGRPW